MQFCQEIATKRGEDCLISGWRKSCHVSGCHVFFFLFGPEGQKWPKCFHARKRVQIHIFRFRLFSANSRQESSISSLWFNSTAVDTEKLHIPRIGGGLEFFVSVWLICSWSEFISEICNFQCLKHGPTELHIGAPGELICRRRAIKLHKRPPGESMKQQFRRWQWEVQMPKIQALVRSTGKKMFVV